MQETNPKRWKIPKIWPGNTCFVIGGGPSLKEVNLDLIKDKRIIGVNSAYKLGDWVDVCWFGDCRWYDWNLPDLLQFAGLKVTCCRRTGLMPGIKQVLRAKPDRGLSPKNDRICWNKNSGASAINLAYHFGVKRVVLIAFDMEAIVTKTGKKKEEIQHNWHDEYKNRHQPKAGIYKDRFLPVFPEIARSAKNLGLEIINANPNSVLDVFPKVRLEEVL